MNQPPHTLWSKRAALAQRSLLEHYWNASHAFFEVRVPFQVAPNDLPTDPFHYWWQAHAMDTLLDAFERDGDPQHLERVGALLRGVLERNGGQIVNDYYDDMAWMALALLRAYLLSGENTFLQRTLELWTDLQGGWNEHCGGGIAWRKIQLDYKNTPANAPVAILAARLHRHFQRPQDLEWAVKIYAWLEHHLVDPETGFVWDGMNREGNGLVDLEWALSYNEGTFIGAAQALWLETADPRFRNAARRTLEATRAKLCDPHTLELPAEGGGDGGLFKGILVRYATDWALENDPQALELLEANAKLLWKAQSESLLFGPSWTQSAPTPNDLSSHLSGVMLLEAMAKLEKAGKLEGTLSLRSS